MGDGDARKAIHFAEEIALSIQQGISSQHYPMSKEQTSQILSSSVISYDRTGDDRYNSISFKQPECSTDAFKFHCPNKFLLVIINKKHINKIFMLVKI